MFQGVGLEGIDVQDIKLIGDAPTDGTVNFQVLNANRKMIKSFAYYGAGAEVEGEYVGWYDGDGTFEAPDHYTFQPGDAIMLEMPVANGGIQIAGEVPSVEAVVALKSAGYYLVGNPMPIEIDVQDLKVGAGAKTDGTLNFQVLNASRKMVKSFAYYGAEAEVEGDLVGWYDGDGTFEAPDTYAIQPGDAVMLETLSPMTLTINPPVIK